MNKILSSIRSRWRSDDGFAYLEMVVAGVPLFIFGVVSTLAALSMFKAVNAAASTSSEAARAASLEQTPGGANAAAQESIDSNIAESGVDCESTIIEVGELEPGSIVEVTVSCTSNGLGFLGGEIGSFTFERTAFEIVDKKRTIQE